MRPDHRHHRQRGVALPLVLLVSAIVLLLGMLMLQVTVTDLTFTTANRNRTRAFYAAELGLARAFDKIRTDYYGGLANWQPNVVYAGTGSDDTGSTPAQKAQPDEQYHVAGDYYETTATTPEGTYLIRYRTTASPWATGGAHAMRTYQIEAVARETSKGTWSGLRTTYTAVRTMLWDFAAFFKDDIELNGNATISFTGTVHTNKNIFLSGAAGTTTSFDGTVTAAGRISRNGQFHPHNQGTVRFKNEAGKWVNMTQNNDGIQELSGFQGADIRNPAKGDGLPNPADTWKVDPNWRQGALDNWDGLVRDAAHGVIEQAPPPIQSVERGGYYEANAGLKIITRTNGKTQIVRANGTIVDPASLGANNPISTGSFWNGRERKTVSVTNVDIGKLAAAGLYPDNGLIYSSREDAVADSNPLDAVADNSRKPNGIRLVNGDKLPAPMTFVTNNPLYVEGNFNRHRDAKGRSPGQSGYDPSTDTWQPCATIADATTFLSDSWSDAANKSANNRTVSANTEINMVLVSGNHSTNATEGYSGGLNNYPRLLENWTNRTLTFRGSFIQLWQSKFATGPFADSPPEGFSYYRPPTRDFGIDPAFGAASLPPGFANLFPSVTSAINQGKWQQLEPGEALLSI